MKQSGNQNPALPKRIHYVRQKDAREELGFKKCHSIWYNGDRCQNEQWYVKAEINDIISQTEECFLLQVILPWLVSPVIESYKDIRRPLKFYPGEKTQGGATILRVVAHYITSGPKPEVTSSHGLHPKL